MLKRTPSLLLLIVLALGLGFGGVSAAPANQVSELIIFWAQWPPADYLQEIGNRYEAETGIKVNVVQEPWGSFYDVMAAEWAARVTLTIWSWGDSQWLGQGAEQGHLYGADDFMVEKHPGRYRDPRDPEILRRVPRQSGRYWAYPTEGDAVGWPIARIRFEDPREMAAFEAEYGYPLAVPETW